MGKRSGETPAPAGGAVVVAPSFQGQIEHLKRLAIDPLDPERLSPAAAEAAKKIRLGKKAKSTYDAIDSAMRYWSAWYALRYGQSIALPVSVPTVTQFIVDHVGREVAGSTELKHELPDDVDRILCAVGRKAKPGRPALSTVLLRVSALSMVHNYLNYPNPVQDPGIRDMLSGAQQTYANRDLGPKGKDALDRERFDALLRTFGTTPADVRDRAMLMFAFNSGGRRRSEVVNATLGNLKQFGASFKYLLPSTKTGKKPTEKPVKGKAAQALRAWLEIRGLGPGALFCRFTWDKDRENRIPDTAHAVTGDYFRRMVQRHAEVAGLGHLDLSPHSIRSGFITESGRRNKPLFETMLLTGHTTMAMPLRYYRSGEVLESPVADLLGE